MERLLRVGIARILLALALFFAAAVCFGFGSESLGWRIVPSAVLGFGLLALTYFWSRRGDFSFRITPPGWLLFVCIALGLALRIGIAFGVHPVEVSDMASYDYTARHLLAAHEYVCKEGQYVMRAYRPPGVAFLLAAAMSVAGPLSWTPLLVNCILFTGACCLLWFAVRPWSAGLAGLILILFSLWPSEVAAACLPQSETPTVFVSTALIYILLRVRGLWTTAIALGLVTGLSCLIRNSNLVMVGVWVLVLLVKPAPLLRRLTACALLVLCCFAPILPWTARNYKLFHKPVLVATNGGENMWTSNNSYTSGSFDERAVKDVRAYLPDELAADQAGFALARQWIRSHPLGFAKLSLNKVRILLGQDAWGWYYVLERGRSYTGAWYQVLSLSADVWWLSIWIVLLRGLLRHPTVFENSMPLLATAAFTLGPALLFFLFQSQPRYHAFMIPGLLCMMGANLPIRGNNAAV